MGELADLSAAFLFVLLNGLVRLLLDAVLQVLSQLREGLLFFLAELIDHFYPALVVLLDLVAQLLDYLGVELFLLLQLDVYLGLLLRVVFCELMQLEDSVVELDPNALELLVLFVGLILLVEAGAGRGQHFHLLIVIYIIIIALWSVSSEE